MSRSPGEILVWSCGQVRPFEHRSRSPGNLAIPFPDRREQETQNSVENVTIRILRSNQSFQYPDPESHLSNQFFSKNFMSEV